MHELLEQLEALKTRTDSIGQAIISELEDKVFESLFDGPDNGIEMSDKEMEELFAD